jgi:hypothetical protein
LVADVEVQVPSAKSRASKHATNGEWTWSAKVQARYEFLVTIKTFTMFFHEVMLSVVPCYTTIVAHILLVYEAQWCMRDTIIYVTQQYVRQNSIWGIVVYETQQCERHSSM